MTQVYTPFSPNYMDILNKPPTFNEAWGVDSEILNNEIQTVLILYYLLSFTGWNRYFVKKDQIWSVGSVKKDLT